MWLLLLSSVRSWPLMSSTWDKLLLSLGCGCGTCWCCKKASGLLSWLLLPSSLLLEGGCVMDEAVVDPSSPRAPPVLNSLAQLEAVTAKPEALEPWTGVLGPWPSELLAVEGGLAVAA